METGCGLVSSGSGKGPVVDFVNIAA